MQINYDPQADALYIQLKDGEIDNTQEVNKYIFVDLDQDGIPLGLEILFAKRVLDDVDLASITINISRPSELAGDLPISSST